MCIWAICAGRQPFSIANAAAVPTACPSSAQVPITRDELMAAWVTEMLRPANIRFGTASEYRHPKGMPYGEGAG